MIVAVFYFFAAMAVISAVMCITQRSPIASAIWLTATMLALAAIFVLHSAQFIGAIQVLVYAGAVMVLFLFVIMLLNLSHTRSDRRGLAGWLVALVLIGALTAELLPLWRYSPERVALEYTKSPLLAEPAVVFDGPRAAEVAVDSQGVTGAIAGPLFEIYLVPFELTSILLLTAIVGAVVLAKRKV